MAKDHLSGKLRVILHADIAGSTALVQQDEQLAHERIQHAFLRFSKIIKKYMGTVLELRGDAILAEFERASDAVSAALAFQVDHTRYLTQLNDDLKPAIRVGVSMGEVVIANNTVTGAGVVLAQRVEQLAQPGGLCITGAIHEALPRRMPFDLETLGERELKGFDYPVQVYRVELSNDESIPPPEESSQKALTHKTWKLLVAVVTIFLVVAGGSAYWFNSPVPPVEAASVERMAYPLPDRPSIAVLPFANMSNDESQEYFADGMTEDLITDLSKIPELFVISRNSTFTYKGQAVMVRAVAEELGVRYVLEGSVRRVGNEVRINAQLIDALSGGHVWAERYDGSLADIFDLQDSVTEQIVTALALNLTGERTSKKTTASTQAYDLFLQGWAHYQRHTAEDSSKAIPLFEAAIRLDPKYAQAQAAQAAVYWETWDNHWTETLGISRSDAMKIAKTHLQEAMKEPSSLAHWVASNILIAEGHYESAITEAEQIVALDANNADGYATLANALALSGKSTESDKLLATASRLNPNASPLHNAAQKGDVDSLRQLIVDQVPVDARDYRSKTALHVAAEIGQAEIVTLLIKAGADIEARIPPRIERYFGATPLILASREGNTEVAKLLINAGANVNTRNTAPSQWTALHIAAFSGHKAVAELLIANGAEVNATAVRGLSTPLGVAANKGHVAMAELLVSKGANVNAADVNAYTPLHFAAISGNFDIVQLLLANDTDVNARTIRGTYPGATALHFTTYAGNTLIVELLLARGADIDATDQFGYTPLRRSVDQGDLAMAELLINNGADIATRDSNGVTLLHIVAQTDRVALASLLVNKGAEINAMDINSGFTPLDYAQDGDEVMIELLKQHGAICTIC
jgi:adenylate cyclase